MIPDSISSMEDFAFGGCTSLISVTLGNGVTSIGEWVFSGCPSLTSVYFAGNAPSIDSYDTYLLYSPSASTINYYLPGTTGWGEDYGGRPTAFWLPTVQTDNPGFGIQGGQLGFTISWASDRIVVVEASGDLSTPDWTPVSTNILVDGASHFTDPEWTNHSARFYRLRSP